MDKKIGVGGVDTSATVASGGKDGSPPGAQTKPPSKIFHSVVVVDFISNPVEDLLLNPVNDPEMTYEESLKGGVNMVDNPGYISKMPRNSIIGIRTSDRAAYEATDKKKKYEIFFPFFSPHLSLPVKPGEEAWVVYENSGNPSGIGYWLTRKCATLDVDDINFTHGPRESLSMREVEAPDGSPLKTYEGVDLEDSANPMGFPLGGGRVKSNNLIPDIDGGSAFEYIITNSNSYQTQFTSEPVPRFSKRSPDFTLQGSNNTLICLGEDRGRNSALTEGNTIPVKVAGDPDLYGRGAIDIVAGRSVLIAPLAANETVRDALVADTISETSAALTLDPAAGFTAEALDVKTMLTLPAAVGKNARDKSEIDKTPDVTESSKDGSNPAEGDPDFINDLSRIYISMKTNVDENFEIETKDTAMVKSDGDVPGIVIKSDQVRIIAREDVKFMVGPADDGAAIVLKADGNIVFIPGAKGVIKLGGDDASKAVLCLNGATGADVGVVASIPMACSAGGAVGQGAAFGEFSTKVLVK